MASLKAAIVQPTAKHTATVIFLHGLGDTGLGWEPVGRMLAPAFKHVKWIFPHAPHKKVTLNMGMAMPAWYDIYSLDKSTAKEDESGMLATVEEINRLIKTEIDAGISSDKIVLGGFSQGGAMTLLTGLTTNHKLGALVALSGYLPLSSKIESIKASVNDKTPIFMGHGTDDQVVQYEWGKKSMETLKSMGFNVTFRPYSGMGHSACDDELRDLSQFLSSKL
ncbi:hypothetical protein HDV04_003369 [Boothiomyces sp. JEL0838]|nr:hypothetical protein HDV04_003369 [Boothiomyces sp. JEL0838]